MAEVYYVPSGPKNLHGIADFVSVDWNQVADYWLEITSGGSIIATTPLMKMGCCCEDDGIIIHFRQYGGGMDQIPFQRPTISHDTKSEFWKKSLRHPLNKQDTGWNRNNVTAQDTYEAKSTCLNDGDKNWAQELVDTTIAFKQFQSVQGEGALLVPITILDGAYEKQVWDDGSFRSSSFVVKFRLGNDYIIQRN